MKATRRDFREVVNLIRLMEKGVTRRLMWAHAFAKILKKGNPQFNERLFIDACGADQDPENNA